MEDVEWNPLSSAGQFRRFLGSTEWMDMLHELNAWLENARSGLEDTDSSIEEIYRNQGRVEACRCFIAMPEIIMSALEEAQKAKEEDMDSNE